MMEKHKMEADLAVIKQIMLESRQQVANIGINLVVWSGIVIICLMLSYYSITNDNIINEGLIWGIGFGIAWIFEFFLYRFQRKQDHDSTFSGDILSRLWLAVLVSMMIVGIFGGLRGIIEDGAGSGILAVFLAIGYLVSGTIMNSKWVKLLGLGWWAGSILIFYSTNFTSILIWIFLMIFLQFIPGVILLIQEHKKRKNSESV